MSRAERTPLPIKSVLGAVYLAWNLEPNGSAQPSRNSAAPSHQRFLGRRVREIEGAIILHLDANGIPIAVGLALTARDKRTMAEDFLGAPKTYDTTGGQQMKPRW